MKNQGTSVEAHRRAFGMTLGTLHAAIEIQADRPQGFLLEALQNHVATDGLLGGDASLVKLREHPTDRRHAGQDLQAQHALDQRIFPIESALA